MCTNIFASAFYSCSELTSLNFPICSGIGSYAFVGCSALTSINFPECTTIGGSAFRNCSALTTANFPICASISTYAFAFCFNLISLYLNSVSAVPTLAANVFNSTPIGDYSTSAGRYGSIFVPASLFESFKTATNWIAYSSRFVSV